MQRRNPGHTLWTIRSAPRALSLGLLVGLLSLSGPLPLAWSQATQDSFEQFIPFDTTAADPCGTLGEVVRLQGIGHIWGHVTQTPTGGFSLTFHSRLEDVVATGETTGTSYGSTEQQLIAVSTQARNSAGSKAMSSL
jgi:hypothetical protein